MSSRPFMVIGSGWSISKQPECIREFIKRYECATVGVNKMNSLVVPDYHLWTNRQRYRDLGSCVNPKSHMLFGPKFPKRLIRKHYSGNYDRVRYDDDPNNPEVRINDDGSFGGYYRTAGALAIVLAYSLGASYVYVVGMDGFTLHAKKDVYSSRASQHCYGSGHTDDYSWKDSILKDETIYECLRNIHSSGFEFKILTETKYKDFYDPIEGFMKE